MMTLTKFKFETEKDFINWLFKTRKGGVAFRDTLAKEFGVNFQTKYEAGISKEDTGEYAGVEYWFKTQSKMSHFPKSFPAVLGFDFFVDKYGEVVSFICWFYESDLKK